MVYRSTPTYSSMALCSERRDTQHKNRRNASSEKSNRAISDPRKGGYAVKAWKNVTPPRFPPRPRTMEKLTIKKGARIVTKLRMRVASV